jgi:LmbE family N-acetylglucosaminyl deacetylase
MIFDGSHTVLVIGAHPDDEVLGAGGTIAKHAACGDDVHVLVVTEGTTHQYDDPNPIEDKQEHTRACADVLGVSDVHFGGLPDMQLDTVAHVDVNDAIETVCAAVEPDIVYTHSRREVNQDHVAVHDSTLVAARPGSGVSAVLAYETPSSTDFAASTDGFTPSLFVDISEYVERKITAFTEYETEIREFPHPRSPDALRAIATTRGVASGVTAAEAFDILRAYR